MNNKKGIIIKQISNLYTVKVEDKEYDSRARGKFYIDNVTPLVGDQVTIDIKNKYILEILPRKNSLSRPSIANVDACIIISSVKEPKLDLNLLDKLLTIVINEKVEPIICFTKLDLLSDEELKEINFLIDYYQKIGIKTFTNTNLKLLIKAIKNKVIVLTGQSGAGKSTLLNKLDESFNIKTNKISKALGRGVHTTRHVELFSYKESLIADTPGFSSLDINKLTNEEIKNTFPEFKVNCQFKDCNHINEKKCQVKKDLEDNIILKSRYNNYLKFVREK